MSLFYTRETFNNRLLSKVSEILKESPTKKEIAIKIGKFYDEERKKMFEEQKKRCKNPIIPYQLFLKETLPKLIAREDAKGEGEEKLKQTDLIKEVAKMWKEQQTSIKPDIKENADMLKEQEKQSHVVDEYRTEYLRQIDKLNIKLDDLLSKLPRDKKEYYKILFEFKDY
jgi:hypothetical protein